MASSQQKSEQTQISNTTDALTKDTVSNALLDTLDAVIPENVTGITDPGKKNANGSANETAESIQVSRTPEQIEEEKKKILTQVEYYFGDKNLPNDKFLNEVRSKNSQGWVPLRMICKFKKMQIYKDYDLIIEALRESPNLLEVDEQGEHVRRKTLVMIDIPQSIKDSAIWRSIYVKGFNKDEIDSNYEKEVASFFSQYSKVEKAFARREDDGTYKDSFFIQFATHEEAKKVSEMDLSYKNSKLTMMMKFDYCEMKCIEKGLDPNTMRLQKQSPTKKEKRNNKWTPGCLLHFEGAGPNSTYLTIRMQMHNHFGDVRYVQYDSKNSSGVIEFEHPIAHKIIDSIPFENVEFDGIKPKLRVLKGNEEKDFYQKRKSEKIEKTKQSNALKAEFGINTEEDSVTNTNVRGKSRSRGNARGRRSGKKAEKQNTESSGQKIKTESQDEPDDNIKVEEDQERSKKQNTESSGQKIKTESQDKPDDNIKVEEDQEKAKKQNTESNNQKRKMNEPDDDVPASGRSLTLTKKSRIGEIAPEVLPSSSERKRKAADLDDPDGTQGERPKSPKLDIADE